jgi:hypothetical protein
MSEEAKSVVRDPALSVSKNVRGCSGCFAWVFALMFLGIGGIFFYMLALKPWFGIWSARQWVEVPCTVVSSDLKHDDDGNSQIHIVFKYSVDRQEYQSETYCFMQGWSNTATAWKLRVIKNHPVGKQTTCFVNPRDPTEAVIERGWVPEMWWGFFPIPFLLVGFAAALVALGVIRLPMPSAHRSTTANWKPEEPKTETSADTMESEPMPAADGPVTLKASSSPIGNLIGMIFIAAFWNGIVSVFVISLYREFQRGQFGGGDWFVAAFLTPFVLIGLGLIGGVFYTFLALFNPRPTLTINSASIPLGGLLKIQWRLTGRVSSIHLFKVWLEGVEKATYRRGTDTRTDSETFAKIDLFETTDLFEMAEGSAEVEIPGDTMHSFNAPNNKIEWSLHVHGDIALWPDVSASFPITVLPRPLEATA